jgi:hypothetical protein
MRVPSSSSLPKRVGLLFLGVLAHVSAAAGAPVGPFPTASFTKALAVEGGPRSIPTQLSFGQQPTETAPDELITPPVTVRAEDALGNLDTSFDGNITIEIGNNPGGGDLDGTTTVAAVNGIATFNDLSIHEEGTGYTLVASTTVLAIEITRTSDAFNITEQAATELEFDQHPTDTPAGATISPPVTVHAINEDGDVDTSFNEQVTIAIDTNPAGGTLSGTTTVAAVNGVATFNDLSIDNAGNGYTLNASASGLQDDTSESFEITAPPVVATQLEFGQQPTDTQAGATISPPVTVRAVDGSGSLDTAFSGNVTIGIGTNPSGGALSGTTTVAAVNGVATFSDLSIDNAGNGYTLNASASGLNGTTSNAFNITAAPVVATQLAFGQQPSDTQAGATISPPVTVRAVDGTGTLDTAFSGNVTIAIGTNPSGGALAGTTTVAAVNGVATFSNLSINNVGNGYTLNASASGLNGTTSNAFNITARPASRLEFGQQPTTTPAGVAISPPITVRVLDGSGNLVTTFSDNVSIVIGTNPAGGTLSGTATVAAVNGVATFSNLRIDKVGNGYTLTALASGLTSDTSDPFDITAGAATQLAFGQQPSNTRAGSAITPPVTVRALDSSGNLVTSFSGNVTVAIGANPAGGALSGTTTVAAVNGVATFSNLSIDKAGNGYTLNASASGVNGATSNTFNITGGVATRVEFGQQPTDTPAGAPISPAVTVRTVDSSGNLDTAFSGNVTITIGANPAGGTLSGTTTVAVVNGVATFNNLRINRVGSGYTLVANAGGLTGATSSPFAITAGTAVQLTFGQQPTNTAAGATITPPVTVRALDSSGNLVTSFSGNVTIAIGTNPTGGTLSGTTTVAAVNGIATFSSLRIDKAGNGYTLNASAAGLNGVTSNPFDITAGAAARLVIGQQPTDTPAGGSITPAVTVRALDASGNLATAFTGNVTIAIGANPSGGTLSGTTTVGAVGGVATFSNLRIDRAGSGYTLVATASGLTSATSNPFTITPADAARLAFTQQPTNTPAGAAITPAVRVQALDGAGNLDTSFNGNVTIAIGTNPAAGTLSGTTTVAAVGGIATFGNLRIDKAGNGYTLVATTSGLTSATSNPFNVTPGPAAQLVFAQQPTNTAAGAAITPAVTVRALDASGNLATSFTGNVTIAIGTNPAGGILSGTTTVAAVGGVATFSNLRIDKAGSGYTLVASAPGLTSATSNPFDITTGAATQLAFGQQPTDTPAGSPITPPVTVRALDGSGNLVTSFSGNVTIAIGANPAGGTLSGTTTMAAVNGVATFNNLRIDRAGSGYTLTATASGLSMATSSAFAIVPSGAARLVFGQQPTNTAAGATITPPVTVRALDGSGNLNTSFSGNVTIALGSNPAGGTLSGTTTVAAVNGVATFNNLRIDRAGSGYTLTASASGLTSATSNSFAITAGTAARLEFVQQPTTTPSGATIAPPVTVRALDSGGNPSTSFSGNVTIAIGNGPIGSTVSGTTTVAAVNGVATFNNLRIDRAGTGYTLIASSPGLLSATSIPFAITAAGAARLVFDQQPTNTPAGAAITPAVTVRALDSSGNLNTAFSGSVTIALGTNPAGGILSGTTTVTAINGVATFSNLRIDRPGTGYTLVATAAGLASASSTSFSIVSGGASGATTTITANPTSVPADGVTTSTITVQARAGDGTPRTVGGEVVQLTTTAGTLGVVQDNGNGTYTAILTAASTPGTATISGTINGATISDTATVEFTASLTDLAVTATVNDPTPAVGETIVYMITVTNQGLARATGVVVTDQLPPRLTFVSAHATQGVYEAPRGVWTVGTLEPGASATLEISARVQ